MNGRYYSALYSGRYRYACLPDRQGFNGKESDAELSAGEVAFEYRIFDARIAKFFSLDPRQGEYPWQTPYAYYSNSPIAVIDYLGGGHIVDLSEKVDNEGNSGDQQEPDDKKHEDYISISDIKAAFNDGKEAKSYSLTVYVDQPKHGSQQQMDGSNVGHTFIKLSKLNTDGTYTERIFGYYPSKDGKLDGSPANPKVKGEFHNNNGHIFDVYIQKEITKEQFDAILASAESFEKDNYDLYDNNCTDFGKKAASLAGMTVYYMGYSCEVRTVPLLVPYSGGVPISVPVKVKACMDNPGDFGQDIIWNKLKLASEGILVYETSDKGEYCSDQSVPIINRSKRREQE